MVTRTNGLIMGHISLWGNYPLRSDFQILCSEIKAKNIKIQKVHYDGHTLKTGANDLK